MSTINFSKNVEIVDEANSPTGINNTIQRNDWLGFLDALGQLESSDRYNNTNQAGYIGIYQFAPYESEDSILETLKFIDAQGSPDTIALMLNVTNSEQFLDNPIAQELAAIMEFSGIPDLSLAADDLFASKYTAVRNAPAFSKSKFDLIVDEEITVTYLDSAGNIAT